MAINKQKKEEIQNRVAGIVKDSKSVVFVNFHGLKVVDTEKLRDGLSKDKIGYTVAKKTLVRRALDSSNIEGEIPQFDGELALAYGDDLVLPASGVYSFTKDFKDNISIIGGIFEGKYMDKEGMTAVAQIPPVPVLRGQFVNLINSPIQSFVTALDKIAEKKS